MAISDEAELGNLPAPKIGGRVGPEKGENVTLNWVLVFHIFGVVFWVGSLLLISSLMALVPEEVGVAKERIIVLARRLLLVSANTGAAVAIIFGILAIVANPGVLARGWLHLKLVLVLLMLVVQFRMYQRIRALAEAPLDATRREFSIMHGLVSLLLLGTLMLVFLKPF
ncbi:MAG: CopD family protein [Deltaproteobacteria bacterium]|nr:CopD family protein [Deltaproteobacteria bacterium]MBV8454091.1 CopD family protein [Deltaproteobacteria bacterium]